MAKSIAKEHVTPIPTFFTEPSEQTVMKKMYEMMANPIYSRADLMRFIRKACLDFPYLTDSFGIITDDMIDEVDEIFSEAERVSNVEIDRSAALFNVEDVVKMDKRQKQSIVSIPTREEARFLVDIYYQTQNKRIVIQNQLRALKQHADSNLPEDANTNAEVATKNTSILEWYLYNMQTMENSIAKALEAFADTNYLAKWAKSVKGIGPVIATCLVAELEIKLDEFGKTDMKAGNWWSFCGLNDNNRPWLGNKQATAIVDEVIKANDGILDDEVVAQISARTQWPIEHYRDFALKADGTYDKQKIITASTIIPYNKKLKVLMYKIGHSFLMNQNKDDSLYGRLLKQRKDMETQKNANGDYADQAADILEKKNFSKSTIAYKHYSEGKLPPGHIQMRAMRYATKLFISHLYEAAYYNQFGEDAPEPYVLSFVEGHADYIPPEVAYNSIERDVAVLGHTL